MNHRDIQRVEPPPMHESEEAGHVASRLLQQEIDALFTKHGITASGLMGVAMLPTPATRDYKGANSPEHLAKERGHHDQLPNAIAMLRTPTAAEAKNQDYSQQTYVQNQIAGESPGLKLHPDFVEWMLGYPIGYTDLRC